MKPRISQYGSWAVLLAAWVCGGIASADSVQFRLGESPPPLAIDPAAPTTTDVISFTTPLDGITYSNDCEAASALGGAIIQFRDDPHATVDLGYDGNPPGACPRIYLPVTGAEGDFGPLAAGQWTLQDAHGNSLSFLVVPEPATASLMLAVVIGYAIAARRLFMLKRVVVGGS